MADAAPNKIDNVVAANEERSRLSTRKIARQLVKEFWKPAGGAIIWAALSVPWGMHTVEDSIARFSAAFFLLSYANSQFYRVSKQVRTEGSLDHIRNRLEDVVEGLEAGAEATIGYATGGRSWAHFSPVMLDNGGRPEGLFVVSEGAYPVLDLRARISDVDALALLQNIALPAAERPRDINVEIGNLNAGYGLQTRAQLALYGEDRRFNVFFSARNGGWVQKLRYRLEGATWHFATRVERYPDGNQVEVLLERTPPTFPNAHTIDWG